MKSLCQCCTVLLLVLLASSSWAAPPQEQAQGAIGRGTIRFKLFGGFLIVIEGRIGDHEKLKFAVDTGVTYSVIDNKLADRIPTPRRRLGKILSFDKTIDAESID